MKMRMPVLMRWKENMNTGLQRKGSISGRFYALIHKKLDVDRMNEAAKILLEYRDFQCFSRNKTGVKTYHCDIKEAVWKVQGAMC